MGRDRPRWCLLRRPLPDAWWTARKPRADHPEGQPTGACPQPCWCRGASRRPRPCGTAKREPRRGSAMASSALDVVRDGRDAMGDLPRSVETVVIGAGQAGLMMSWHLQRAGREHVVLERRPTLGGGWQDRWDAFTLVSPNWMSGLPGDPYDGTDPDGFMRRDAIAARVAPLRRGHRGAGPSLDRGDPRRARERWRPTVPGLDRPRAARRRRGDHGDRRLPRAADPRDERRVLAADRAGPRPRVPTPGRPGTWRRAGRRDGPDRLPARRGAPWVRSRGLAGDRPLRPASAAIPRP